MATAATIVADALISGEMYDLLRGEGHYKIVNRYLDTPTEDSEVFHGIMDQFGDSPATVQEFLDEVIRMTKEPDYSWFSAYYLYSIVKYRQEIKIPFDLQRFSDEALRNIHSHEGHLRNLRRWAGASDPDGCWGYVDRLMQQLKRMYETADFKVNW